MKWLNHKPYRWLNSKTYINHPHVEEGRLDFPDVASAQIRSKNIFIEPQTNRSYCVGMWFHDSYIDHTSWVTVPCDGLALYSAGIICEQEASPIICKNHSDFQCISTQEIGYKEVSIQIQSITIKQTSVSCKPFWTFINGFCYRIIKMGESNHQWDSCSFENIPTTHETASEFIKRHVFAFLEYIYMAFQPNHDPVMTCLIRLTWSCKCMCRHKDWKGVHSELLSDCDRSTSSSTHVDGGYHVSNDSTNYDQSYYEGACEYPMPRTDYVSHTQVPNTEHDSRNYDQSYYGDYMTSQTHYEPHTQVPSTEYDNTGHAYWHEYSHTSDCTTSYGDGPSDHEEHIYNHAGDGDTGTTFVNENDHNMVGMHATNEEMYGQQIHYHEDRLEHDLDTNDTTHSTTHRFIQRTYDPLSNTYCHTKIEQYYTTTYTE